MPGMTDRDHFAAAALAGLLFHNHEPPKPALWWVEQAFDYADAMLRERAKTNLDAVPEAIAPEPEPSAARRRPAGGTGDTQSFDAYRRFVGEVMNWISEATSAADWSSDGGRKIMADACLRCWDAFNCIAYPTVHGASPEARASVESVAPRPSEGTGDTPDSPKPIKGGVSDRSKPITGPDPDSRVWETPVHTPATHATRGEGSVPRDGTQEPAAWGVAGSKGLLYATSISRMDAVDMQSDYAYHTEVVPLYRSPPVTKPMPKEKRAEVCAGPLAWAVCTPGDGDWSPCFFHEPHAQRCASAIFGSKNIVPLYRSPTLTDAEVTFLRRERDLLDADDEGDCKTLEIIAGLLERMGGGR